MKNKTKYERAKMLVDGGSTVTGATKKVGMKDAAYYYWHNKERGTPQRKKRAAKLVDVSAVTVPVSSNRMALLIGNPADILEALWSFK